jgi:hypothetical protein
VHDHFSHQGFGRFGRITRSLVPTGVSLSTKGLPKFELTNGVIACFMWHRCCFPVSTLRMRSYCAPGRSAYLARMQLPFVPTAPRFGAMAYAECLDRDLRTLLSCSA